MECIDRKFKIEATSIKSGKKYTHRNAVLFLASDGCLPELLEKYKEICVSNLVDERQIKGIELLRERVIAWQDANKKSVHIPDVDEGKEEKRVCKENE